MADHSDEAGLGTSLISDDARAYALERLPEGEGAVWPARAARAVEAATRELDLDALDVVRGGKNGALVRASLPGGDGVVIKVPLRGIAQHAAAQEQLEAAGLGPRVLFVDVERGYLVLDEISIAGLPDTETCGRAVAGILGQLAGAPALAEGVGTSLDAWLRPLLVTGNNRPSEPGVVVPEVLRAQALALLDDLGDPQGPCHGDCWPPNLLFDGTRLWVIDARGVRGEIAFDVAMLAGDSYEGQPDEQARAGFEWAKLAGVDPERVAAWQVVIAAALV